MKKIILPLFILFCIKSYSQNFNGQWRGGFTSNGEFANLEYVLEFTISGDKVEGYSYTYPIINGKKYYDICVIEGKIDRAKKYIEVSEISKVKSNVPLPFRFDCFQTHKLTYFKKDDIEKLEGSWIPAKKNMAQCGSGYTVLERKVFKPIVEAKTDTNLAVKEKPKTIESKKPTVNSNNKTSKKTVEKQKPISISKKPAQKNIATKPKPQNENLKKENPIVLKKDTIVENKTKPAEVTATTVFDKPFKFENRTTTVQNKIEVTQEEITVQLYDNGQVDGDTVTVTYNGKVIVNKQRLSEKPITIKLKVNSNQNNEFVMFAENLGSIPPNTALMVVTAGEKKFSANISSDEKRNGSILFRLKTN